MFKQQVVIFLVILILTGCKTVYEEIPPDLPNLDAIVALDTMDYALDLWDMNGDSLNLNQFKNNVIFLNIWGSWCGPCIREMPGLQRLYDTMKSENVEFLFLSDESLDTIKTFINANDYDLPVYKYNKPLPEALSATSWPTTYIINKRGHIVFRYALSAKWDDPSAIDFIRYLIDN